VGRENSAGTSRTVKKIEYSEKKKKRERKHKTRDRRRKGPIRGEIKPSKVSHSTMIAGGDAEKKHA